MFRAIALLGLAGALAACDFVVQKAEERAAAEIGNAAADLGGVAANFSVNVGSELLKNGKIDLGGVGLVPGGKITGLNMSGGANGPTITATFTAPTSPEEVKAYFLKEFAAKQIAVQEAAQTISGVTREGNSFKIDLGAAASGTQGTIRIDPGSSQR